MYFWLKIVRLPLPFWRYEMEAHFQHCLDIVQSDSPSLYSCLLFLKTEHRHYAAAIYAFHLEIGRIVITVKEPTAGEIRLQWWQAVINGERQGEALASPMAKAVLETVNAHHLPVEGFVRYLEARVFDLYNDPMPDRQTLEAYLGETESFILQMVGNSCGVKNSSALADLCGHGGVAIGIANLIYRVPFDRNAQKVYLPNDLLNACGLDHGSWLNCSSEQATMAIEAFRSLGKEHFSKALQALDNFPKSDHACFLPLVLARLRLKKAEGFDGQSDVLKISPLAVQFALWKSALCGI